METTGIHPIAILLSRDIYLWGRKRTFFYKYYFERKEIKELRVKLERYFDEKDFYFKCLIEDGYSLEQIVKIRFQTKQREKRLKIKLKELNLEPWDISTTSSSFHLTAKHNNIEIFNEKFSISPLFFSHVIRDTDNEEKIVKCIP
jgi:hypothetical protein